MPPACELIGALPTEDSAGVMLVGVACGSTLHAACSLVFSGQGRRHLRVDLSPVEVQAVAAVLRSTANSTAFINSSGGPTSALAARVDGQVVLLVDGLRLRVNGPELTVSLRRALERHISQPAIAGAC